MTTASKILAQPNTDEWLRARDGGVGASEAAVASGVSEYETPRELYHRKRGELPPKEQTEAMRRGHLLEPIIVSEFSRVTGLQIQQYPMGLMQHQDHPIVLATPDAQITEKAGLECKSTNWRLAKRLGQEGTEDVPNEWLCQVQQQMAVTGWERVHVAVWIDRDNFKTFCVERNQTAIELLIKYDLELWARIEAGDPPPHEWTADSRDLMRALYREVHSDSVIRLDERQADLWARRCEFRQEAGRMYKRADALEAEFLAEIGNAAFAVLPGEDKMVRRKKIAKEPYTVTPKPYVDTREVNVSKPVREVLIESEESNGRG